MATAKKRPTAKRRTSPKKSVPKKSAPRREKYPPLLPGWRFSGGKMSRNFDLDSGPQPRRYNVKGPWDDNMYTVTYFGERPPGWRKLGPPTEDLGTVTGIEAAYAIVNTHKRALR